ncbi:hypothetical protein [Rickettsia endosymbiont of Orchestes rusci]|uniref:hypothetical protein n=1 Tax=Rickettsia endosymbiont of Orchestes rusci TaxID=3066250 RepID=UPI00313A956A
MTNKEETKITKEEAKNLLDINESEFEILMDFGSNNFDRDAKKLLTNIGLCYKLLGEIEKSNEYFAKAREYEKPLFEQIINTFICVTEEFLATLLGNSEDLSDSES